MGRNLVVCLDGTGNQVRARGNTNVVRLYGLLEVGDPERQVVYYDPGVGTFAAAGAWTPWARRVSRVVGLAFGVGMRQNLGEAYTWLMRTWQPGDRVFVFGFSRGAYTARALVGMLRAIGLLRPGSENLVPYAVATYTSRAEGEDYWGPVHAFSEVFAQQVDRRSTIPVAYLGLWDTVKAAGVLRWDVKWPWTRKVVNAARVRHAVSIDERRRPYREYLVDPGADTKLEEVWFAGVHSDVGGTFDDDPRLSTVALRWMVDGAIQEGLLIDPARYATLTRAVTPDSAVGVVHRMGRIWAVLTFRRRPIPPGARVHASVAARRAAVPGYDPPLPDDVVWVDPDWASASG